MSLGFVLLDFKHACIIYQQNYRSINLEDFFKKVKCANTWDRFIQIQPELFWSSSLELIQFSSVQDGICALQKPHTHSTPSPTLPLKRFQCSFD